MASYLSFKLINWKSWRVGKTIKAQPENSNNQLDRISQEVVNITKSLEYMQEQLDEELAKLKHDIGKIQSDIKGMEHNLLDPKHMMEKLIELQDRSHWNNLRINGVKETPNEFWGICEKKVQDIVENKLGNTTEIEFEHCRCTGKFSINQSKPGTVVCRLLRFK